MSRSFEAITADQHGDRRGTGWIVLAALLLFFGAVFVANGALVYYALSTFSGEQEASPYEHGLAYERDIEFAHAQDARGWNVTLGVLRADPGAPASIAVAMRDANNAALEGLQVSASLEFPPDKHLDRHVVLAEIRSGEYLADLPLRAGQWDVVVEASRNGERLFRTRNRVTLP